MGHCSPEEFLLFVLQWMESQGQIHIRLSSTLRKAKGLNQSISLLPKRKSITI